MAKSVDALVSGTSGRKAVQVRVLFRALIVELMDLSLARRCLEDLVRENDKVEVPFLGTFLAVFIPSSFSSDRRVITPPSRKLRFERREIALGQDRLFIEKLANMADISPDRARIEWKKLIEGHEADFEEYFDTVKHPEIFPENIALRSVSISEEGHRPRRTGGAGIWIPALIAIVGVIAALICYYFGIA